MSLEWSARKLRLCVKLIGSQIHCCAHSAFRCAAIEKNLVKMNNNYSEQNKKSSDKDNKEIELLIEGLKYAISKYLDMMVKEPAIQTLEHELSVQQDIVSILGIFEVVKKLVHEQGTDIDAGSLLSESREELQNILAILKPFIECSDTVTETKEVTDVINKYRNRGHLFLYLCREIQWIAVSLLSGSYISTLILIRSMFELIVGIATHLGGGMSKRIDSISFFSENECKIMKKSWSKLNAWTHPYKKWEKEVCPLFMSHKPIYHPKLYNICISKLRLLCDMFLTVVIEKYGIEVDKIYDAMKEKNLHRLADINNLPFFMERLNKVGLK
jgi:hypothetical protein